MAKSIIGLDIGSNNVKAVELAESGKDLVLKHVGFSPIEAIPDLTNDEDRHRAVIKAIRAVLPSENLKSKKVVTALSGKNVIIRTVSLPKGPVTRLSREEVKRLIIAEIEAEIPFPVEDAALDYYLLEDPATLKEEKIKLMTAVVPKTEIDKNIALIREVGLEHEAIDVIPFALMRGMSVLKNRLNVETFGIIELGAATTEVVVAKDQDLLFTRNIPLGGNLLTRVIQDILNLDYARADNSKVKDGLPQTVTPQFERVATEIRNSLSYFQLQEHKKIDLTFVTGGGAKLKNVLQFLKEKIDIPLEIPSPLENIKNEMKNIPADFVEDIGSFLSVAVGLALKAKKGEKRFNLLPEELRKAVVPFQMIYIGAGVLTSLCLVSLYLFLSLKIKKTDTMIADMTKAVANLNYVVERTQLGKKYQDETARLEKIVEEIYTITPPFPLALEQMATVIPSTVWLREIGVSGDIYEQPYMNARAGRQPARASSGSTTPLKVTILGFSVKTDGVATYMINLKRVPYFSAFGLEGAHAVSFGKEEGCSWTFTCKVGKTTNPEGKK